MPKRKEANKENVDSASSTLKANSKRLKLNSPGKSNLDIVERSPNGPASEPSNVDNKNVLHDFTVLLQNPNKSDEYFVSGEADKLPVYPNLHVENFGLVSLPLNDSQAKDLIKVQFLMLSFKN